jgi:periplasmic divalent cation tolerance protein
MKAEDRIVIFITTGTEAEAHTIAGQLIEHRMAACVNIVPGVDSIFRWNGKVETDRESLLIIKSKFALLQETIDLVKRLHSYEVPEIIAMPVIGGNEEYLRWMDSEVER